MLVHLFIKGLGGVVPNLQGQRARPAKALPGQTPALVCLPGRGMQSMQRPGHDPRTLEGSLREGTPGQ